VAATRVLLVEDEGLLRLVTAEILRDEGFEVVEARTGDEAARLLDGSESFDILFTDVQMPGTLDGVDLAMHLRRRHPTMPVLIVSGYAAQLTRRLGELQPPAVFISKPYDLAEVVRALNGMTGRTQSS
jgi:CheY-like chemotaxis protein